MSQKLLSLKELNDEFYKLKNRVDLLEVAVMPDMESIANSVEIDMAQNQTVVVDTDPQINVMQSADDEITDIHTQSFDESIYESQELQDQSFDDYDVQSQFTDMIQSDTTDHANKFIQKDNAKQNIEAKLGKNVMAIAASILVLISLISFGKLILPYITDSVKYAVMLIISLIFACFY